MRIMEFSISLHELLIALVLASVIYMLESILFARRRQRSIAPDGAEVGEAIRRLDAEMARMHHRLDELEARLGVSATADLETVPAAYDYAVQYARQGMIAPEIADRCGISRDEAALIVAMHRPGQEA
jgi:hypothetical protein